MDNHKMDFAQEDSCCEAGMSHKNSSSGHDHSARMVEDFKKRFWISLVLTIPILILSPTIQEWLRLANTIRFPGDQYVLFIFSSIIFFYGGWPFG